MSDWESFQEEEERKPLSREPASLGVPRRARVANTVIAPVELAPNFPDAFRVLSDRSYPPPWSLGGRDASLEPIVLQDFASCSAAEGTVVTHISPHCPTSLTLGIPGSGSVICGHTFGGRVWRC